MIKPFKFSLFCILILLIISCSKEPETIELKLGHFAATNHAGNEASIRFAEGVKKRTNGKIIIKIYPNNILGAPPEVLVQNIQGKIDMSLPTQGQLAKYSQKFGCVMMPFVFEDYKHADRVLDGKFIEWAAPDLKRAGLIFLSNWEWGFRNLTNNVKPIKNPDDVKGLIIRTPPELPIQSAIEALGGTVKTISFSELTLALKHKIIDGQENPIAVIYSNQIYLTQKYLTMTGHTYNSMVHVISKKSWDKLTKEQQIILKEESKKAGDFMRKKIRSDEDAEIKKLEEFGMEITYPDKSMFKAKMENAYKKLEESVGKDNIANFLEFVEKERIKK
ncbi:MAG: TRAP transporter substrate-binding protein [Spirochaetes bacterium]|nr:TRAP transporter substrate-binding protein [Spirochaetota bacterium]